MQYHSLFTRALVWSIVGFGVACPLASQARADEGIESRIGFGTQNLLQNGDFSSGQIGWQADGGGLKWRVQDRVAFCDLSPVAGASPSRLSLSQIVSKPIRGGTTLCFRFSAKGNARLAFLIYELGSKKPVLARRLRAPETYSANDNEFRTFTFATITPRAYYANELGIQFYLGYDEGQVALSNLRLLDLGQTALDLLPLTPDETRLPDLVGDNSKLEEKLKITPPESAKSQPVAVKVVEIKPASAPSSTRFGANLLKNADFAQKDAGWNAWGNGVGVQLDGKFLKMRLSPPQGANPWDFGLSQTIASPLKRGKVNVRFRAKGNVRFLCKLDEVVGQKQSFFAKQDQASFDEKEFSYTLDLPRDLAANEVDFALFFAYDAGDLTISDFSVSGEETASSNPAQTVKIVPISVVGSERKIEPTARFGSPGLNGEDFANATDGNLQTTFDADSSSDGFTGFDAGAVVAPTKIRFAPRGWLKDRMIGGKFQVAPTQNGPWSDLHTVSTAPEPFKWNVVTLSGAPSGRFFRYIGAAEMHANIGDFEIWGQ